MNLNKVQIIGRLTQDPESKTTPSGQNVTTINMATNRSWTDGTGTRKEATEFHRVVAWGKLGDIASNYLKKGALAYFEGRLQTRSWDDKDSGKKRYMTEIIAENMQMGPRSAGASGGSSYAPPTRDNFSKPAPAGGSPNPDADIPIIGEDEPMNAGIEEDEMKIKESDLPF